MLQISKTTCEVALRELEFTIANSDEDELTDDVHRAHDELEKKLNQHSSTQVSNFVAAEVNPDEVEITIDGGEVITINGNEFESIIQRYLDAGGLE